MTKPTEEQIAAAKLAAIRELDRQAKHYVAWFEDNPEAGVFDDDWNQIGTVHELKYDGTINLDALVKAILAEATIRDVVNEALEQAAAIVEQKTGFEELPWLCGLAGSIRALKHPSSTSS